ncbi:MAG TPA: hypothetical protein VGN20_18275 [Mucilaginibacter sp.]|jgi:hypothetical protein
MDAITKDYAFASGGIFWKIFDRPKFFETRSLREKVFVVLGLALLCWLPLAVLSFFILGWDQFYLLFVRDISTHARFLLVIPLLIFARHFVNNSFNHAINFFYTTKIVDDTNRSAFEQLTDKLENWKNSKLVDYIIIILVYSSFFIQENHRVNSAATYAPWHSVNDHLTVAGWWYLLFSLPVLQLLLFRWLYTTILWIIFLRKISRMNLHLSSLHPDGMGGLGFLRYTQLSFFPVALAFSILTAGVTNNLIIFSGVSIKDYEVAIGSVLVFVLFLFIFPLLLPMPLLAKVKRTYFMQYSLQAWPITREYEDELKAFYKTGEEHPDTSWHVDLLGSFQKTQDMKIIIIDKITLLVFAAAVILPFLPVIAQQVPLKDLFFNLVGKILG